MAKAKKKQAPAANSTCATCMKTGMTQRELAEHTCLTGNDRFLVLDFERTFGGDEGEKPRTYRYQVYLLPPGGFFEGFGGSKSGLVVGKTPSLVVRETHMGQRDTEYDLAAKGVWQFLIGEGLRDPTAVLHGNGAKRDAEGFYQANG